MSIQPKWCELIACGKKTIEVRKTAPKIDTPFKVYIYETHDKKYSLTKEGTNVYDDKKADIFIKQGKVIGEFICDEVVDFLVFENKAVQNWNYFDLAQSCLTYEQIGNYVGANKTGYAWHISQLKIYDKPKELGEFKTLPCEKSEKYCEDCKYKHHDFNGEIYCKDDKRIITRPPQSWMYVEELDD